MTPVLIGIDAGTSTIKSAAFDLDGTEVASSSEPTPTQTPHENWVEQDMLQTWTRVARSLSDLQDELQTNDVLAVGVTGQGDGAWLIDEHGDPVRNAVLWKDGRAAEYVEKWNRSSVTEELYDICGCVPFAGSTLPLLNWIADFEPDRYHRIDTCFYCKDWIKYKLTGTRTTDPSDATLPFLDVTATEYDETVAEIVELPDLPDHWPSLENSTNIVGTVTEEAADQTGLPAGIPVVSGVLDVVASAFGSGVINPGDSSTVLGTTALNQTMLDAPRTEPDLTGFTIALGDNRWMRSMSLMTGTPNIDWLIEELFDGADFSTVVEQAQSVPPGSEGVMYHPYLSSSGERNPFFAPNARAQFTGLTPQHTRAHLARAVYEGVALAVSDCYRHIPIPSDRVVLSGGGARSEFWCQLLSDCLDLDVHVPIGKELGSKGAAVIAGVGTGQYTDIEAAVEKTTATERIYHPRQTPSEIYDKLYELYVMTYEESFDLWDRRQQILNSLPRTEGD